MNRPYEYVMDGDTILDCTSPKAYLPNIKNCSSAWAFKCHPWCIGISHIKHHWVPNNCGVLDFDKFCVKDDFVPWLRAVHKELEVHPIFLEGFLAHTDAICSSDCFTCIQVTWSYQSIIIFNENECQHVQCACEIHFLDAKFVMINARVC